MRIALSIPIRDGGDWGHALQFASEAELMGAASLWSREAWGYDAVTPLAFLAARTSTIGLGTGIMQIGPRSPANVAMFYLIHLALLIMRILRNKHTSL